MFKFTKDGILVKHQKVGNVETFEYKPYWLIGFLFIWILIVLGISIWRICA